MVGSYLPVVSAISMPQRLLAGEAAWWEPILSLLVTVATSDAPYAADPAANSANTIGTRADTFISSCSRA